MKLKAIAWLVIAAQLFPNITAAANASPSAGHGLVLKIARKLARSELFSGPEGMARLENAIQKTMDRQASRIEKAIAKLSDEELLAKAQDALESAQNSEMPALEARMQRLLSSPKDIRMELLRELDPSLRADFFNHVRERLARAGSVEAFVEEFAAGGKGDDPEHCPRYKFSYTEVATGLFSLIWDGLDTAPPKVLVWAIPLLVVIGVIGVPVAFLADTLVFFPIWFFGEHLKCEHGGLNPI